MNTVIVRENYDDYKIIKLVSNTSTISRSKCKTSFVWNQFTHFFYENGNERPKCMSCNKSYI